MAGARGDESDAALWPEVLSGTTASFGVIYDRHRRQVFRKAFVMTGDVSDAEEVVAIVFLEVWRRRKDVRIVEGSLLPWLYTTAGLVALNLERAKRRSMHYTWKGDADTDDVTDVTYRLEETPHGTRFTWHHTGFSGVGGFAMSKLLSNVRKKMLTEGVPPVLEAYHQAHQ